MPISDLLASSCGEDPAHLNVERVERYAADVDALPPVVVFDTEHGLLLADGYHRVAAARRAGRDTIAAEVRKGRRSDALRHAATAGAATRGISTEEALAAIRRRTGDRWRE
jgi:hypothetical protein